MRTTQETIAPFAQAATRVYGKLGRFAGKIPAVQLMICALASDVQADALPDGIRDAALAGLASLSAIVALLPCRADAPIGPADGELTYVSRLADIAAEVREADPSCDPAVQEAAASALKDLCELLWPYSA